MLVKFTSVDDEMPPADTALVVHGGGKFYLGKIGKSGGFEHLYERNYYLDEVTHWARLE